MPKPFRIWTLVLSSVLAGLFALVPSGAAYAGGTIGPAGCDPNGGPGQWHVWDDNCFVGPGWLTSGNYVTGVQRVATGNYCPTYGIDGYYGANTENGIKCLQSKIQACTDGEAQTQDGIVGYNTWPWLWDCFMSEDFQASDGSAYFNAGTQIDAFVILWGDSYWVSLVETVNNGQNGYTAFDVNGPY